MDLCAEAKMRGVKPLTINGQEVYVHVVHPKTFARYKKDADFRDVLVNAGDRGMKNPIFTGAAGFTVDGILFHTSNKVFNTSGATTKWGAGNAIDGTRSLLLGQQALAFADIWVRATGTKRRWIPAPRTRSRCRNTRACLNRASCPAWTATPRRTSA